MKLMTFRVCNLGHIVQTLQKREFSRAIIIMMIVVMERKPKIREF